MPNRRLTSRAVTFVALPLVLACASSSSPSFGRPLQFTFWRLSELRGQPVIDIGGSGQRELLFSFDSGRVSGSAGCNEISGTYTLAEERLELASLASTKMLCADTRLNAQETDFLDALRATNRHAIRGDTLTLAGGDERLARFVAVPR